MSEPLSPLKVLLQDKVWFDRQGVEHQITEMDAEYCGNVLRWLRRRTSVLRFQAMVMVGIHIACGHGYGDERYYAEQKFAYPWSGELTDQEWLEQTPLVAALRHRIDSATDWIRPPVAKDDSAGHFAEPTMARRTRPGS